jgi:hypothetical protein
MILREGLEAGGGEALLDRSGLKAALAAPELDLRGVGGAVLDDVRDEAIRRKSFGDAG